MEAAKEVGPSLFFALLVITVSFLPIFALEGESGRLFKPLAYTKTFAMAGASILAITLIPILMLYFIRGKILPESRNPLSRATMALYQPVLKVILRFPLTAIGIALLLMVVTIYPFTRLGSEFMPPLDEGRPALHAHHLPGDLHHRGQEHPAANGPDHSHLSGGGVCLRQGRPGRNRHRPGAPEHDRDHHPPQGPKVLAPGADHRRAHQGAGRRGEIPRSGQLLGLSHQDPHRHALHRHQDPGGRQVIGRRPGGAQPPGRRGRSHLEKRAGNRQRLCGAHHSAAIIWTSKSTAGKRPATASPSGRCRMSLPAPWAGKT